jgi:galactose mutarotase-like enzyme
LDPFNLHGALMEVKISHLGGSIESWKVREEEIFYPLHTTADGKQQRGGCLGYGNLSGLKAASFKKLGYSSLDMLFFCQKSDQYPWAISCETGFRIRKNGFLYVRFKIQQQRDFVSKPIAVKSGFKPYFACNNANDARLEIAGKEYSGFSREPMLIPVNGVSANIILPERKIEMSFLEGFGTTHYISVWSDAPKKYIVVEPMLKEERRIEQFEFLNLIFALRVC